METLLSPRRRTELLLAKGILVLLWRPDDGRPLNMLEHVAGALCERSRWSRPGRACRSAFPSLALDFSGRPRRALIFSLRPWCYRGVCWRDVSRGQFLRHAGDAFCRWRAWPLSIAMLKDNARPAHHSDREHTLVMRDVLRGKGSLGDFSLAFNFFARLRRSAVSICPPALFQRELVNPRGSL